MKKRNKQNNMILIILIWILLGMSLRHTYRIWNDTIVTFTSTLRHVLYFALSIAWGYSVYFRVIQKQVRRILILVVILILFWMSLRTIQYSILIDDYPSTHLVWYGYYIPMLFIPHLFLLLSLTIGKKKDYRLPKWTWIITTITILFALIVLSNDHHNFVFQLTEGYPWIAGEKHQGVGYWLVFAWILLNGLAGIAILFKESHMLKSHRIIWLPFLPIISALIYSIMYVNKVPIIKILLGDMTTFYSIMFMAVIESCIYSRLIPSNMSYRDLFRISAVPLLILDSNYKLYLKSELFGKMNEEERKNAVIAPIVTVENMRISTSHIRGGYVFWKEDLTDLFDLFQKLEETRAGLEDNNEILRNEYIVESRKKRIEALNDLYNLMKRETVPQLNLLHSKIEDFEKLSTSEEKREVLKQILIIGAYLKRRNNLVLILSQKERISPRELLLSIQEILDCLELLGVDSSIKMNLEKAIHNSELILLFDLFEQIIEDNLCSLHTVMVKIQEIDGHPSLLLTLEGDLEFEEGIEILEDGKIKVITERDEDDAWFIRLLILSGGDDR